MGGQIVLLAVVAAVNPTLLAATTIMLLLPQASRLMLGYLLGALLVSITLGLVIVFALEGSGTVKTTQHRLSPAADIALGGLALILAWVLASDRTKRTVEHRRERAGEKKATKGPPKWQRVLSNASPRTTFVIGALLTLPGATYLAGLDLIAKLGASTAVAVLIVVGFNLVMQTLLEVPLVSFVVAPDWTPGAVERAKAWAGRRWQTLAVRALLILGAALVAKGVLGLIVH
jgi:Sap, sulfolipid-1-addressing protein